MSTKLAELKDKISNCLNLLRAIEERGIATHCSLDYIFGNGYDESFRKDTINKIVEAILEDVKTIEAIMEPFGK